MSGKRLLQLCEAATEGRLEDVVRLAAEAEINATVNDGMTALMQAAIKGHVAAVDALLAKGANADKQDKAGRTALMHATQHGIVNGGIMISLLKGGAGVHLRSKDGRTALHYAMRSSPKNTAILLLHGADRAIFEKADITIDFRNEVFESVVEMHASSAAQSDEIETIENLGIPGKSVFVGQPRVVEIVKMRLSNYRNPISPKPMVLMFNGAAGTGKSLLAEILPQLLFKSRDPRRYFFFNMSQLAHEENFNTLVGAPSGYAGGHGTLYSAVAAASELDPPGIVVHLDEFDKAHANIMNEKFLTMCNERGKIVSNTGFIKDSSGAEIPLLTVHTSHVVFVLTCNPSAEEMNSKLKAPMRTRLQGGGIQFERPLATDNLFLMLGFLYQMCKEYKAHGIDITWENSFPMKLEASCTADNPREKVNQARESLINLFASATHWIEKSIAGEIHLFVENDDLKSRCTAKGVVHTSSQSVRSAPINTAGGSTASEADTSAVAGGSRRALQPLPVDRSRDEAAELLEQRDASEKEKLVKKLVATAAATSFEHKKEVNGLINDQKANLSALEQRDKELVAALATKEAELASVKQQSEALAAANLIREQELVATLATKEAELASVQQQNEVLAADLAASLEREERLKAALKTLMQMKKRLLGAISLFSSIFLLASGLFVIFAVVNPLLALFVSATTLTYITLVLLAILAIGMYVAVMHPETFVKHVVVPALRVVKVVADFVKSYGIGVIIGGAVVIVAAVGPLASLALFYAFIRFLYDICSTWYCKIAIVVMLACALQLVTLFYVLCGVFCPSVDAILETLTSVLEEEVA